MISDRIANVVFASATFVWTLGQVVDIFNITDFQATDKFNGVFLGVVGGALLAKRTAGGEHRK